jgi:hypothetical protein
MRGEQGEGQKSEEGKEGEGKWGCRRFDSAKRGGTEFAWAWGGGI